MAFNIDSFRAKGLVFGGSRPTLFEVRLTLPAIAQTSDEEDKIRFLAQATSLPESTVGSIPVPYFGRVINVSGDRVFAPWSISIMNDEDFKIRSSFESWLNGLNTHVSNRRNGAFDAEEYKTNATVYQLAKTGNGTNDVENAIRAYTFSGLFPTALDPIGLSWGSPNQVESFNVTFAYDYWVPGDDENGDNVGKYNGVDGSAVPWSPKLNSDAI